MRKVLLFMAAGVMSAFFVASCCNCDKSAKCAGEEATECPIAGEMTPCQKDKKECSKKKRECQGPERKEKCCKWKKFDSLSADEQKALLQERKAEIDRREAEMAAKKAEIEQKWANFDNLTIEEQKELIEIKSQCGRGCDMGKGGPRPEHHRGHHDKGEKAPHFRK